MRVAYLIAEDKDAKDGSKPADGEKGKDFVFAVPAMPARSGGKLMPRAMLGYDYFATIYIYILLLTHTPFSPACLIIYNATMFLCVCV